MDYVFTSQLFTLQAGDLIFTGTRRRGRGARGRHHRSHGRGGLGSLRVEIV